MSPEKIRLGHVWVCLAGCDSAIDTNPIRMVDCGMDHSSDVERNRALMKKFEQMINTDDESLGEQLIAPDASFRTPASPDLLYGAKGYLSVVKWMRSGFSDAQWKLEQMVAQDDVVAVRWTLTGTHDGTFLDIPPTGNKIACSVMNFYTFNADGQIINDLSAEGMIGILRGIGAVH